MNTYKRLLILVVILAYCSGCSFIGVRQPTYYTNPKTNQTTVSCTTSRAAPVVDTVFGGLFLLGAGQNAVNAKNEKRPEEKIIYANAAWLGLSMATLWAISAAYGYSSTAKCDDVKTLYQNKQ